MEKKQVKQLGDKTIKLPAYFLSGSSNMPNALDSESCLEILREVVGDCGELDVSSRQVNILRSMFFIGLALTCNQIYRRLKQGSPEWKNVRKRHVTASTLAAVLHVHEYVSKIGLWNEKVSGKESKKTKEMKVHFDRGHRLEPEGLKALKDLFQKQPCVYEATIQDNLGSWIGMFDEGADFIASPDGIIDVTFQDGRSTRKVSFLAEVKAPASMPLELKWAYIFQVRLRLCIFRHNPVSVRFQFCRCGPI